MQIINRSDAKAAGLRKYFTGKPCVRGHVSERNISGTCLQCEREDKAKAYQDDPAKFRARVMARYRATSTRRPRHTIPRQSTQERAAKQQAAVRAHYAKNKPYYMARSMQRRATKMKAVPAWFGEFDRLVVTEANRLIKARRKATGFDWHADHMIPLAGESACGLHLGINIQVIPGRLNRSKGNRLILTNPGEWIRHI